MGPSYAMMGCNTPYIIDLIIRVIHTIQLRPQKMELNITIYFFRNMTAHAIVRLATLSDAALPGT